MTRLNRIFNLTTSNAYVLLVIAPLLWGGNAVAGRMAADDWEPFTITCLRWLCASILLAPFSYQPVKQDWPVVKEKWWVLFLLGSIGMAAFNLAMYLALNYTTAINVSIEQAAMPMLIMLANFIVLSQRVRYLQIVGLILTILGVLVTTTAGNPLRFFSEGLNRGDAIMLLACVFYAGYTFGLRWRPNIHWLSFMWLISISAFVTTLPFALWELLTVSAVWPSFTGWMVLMYVMIFPTIISQLAYARGVELIGSNRAGLFINLVPIFGSGLAVIILGEIFRWYHLIGLVLVLWGIALSERSGRKETL